MNNVTKDKRLALLIGIDKYQDTSISELKGVRYDIEELSKRLSDPNIGNFELYNGGYLFGESAKFLDIRKALSDVFRKSGPYQLIFFYFSGHGFRDGYDNGYIAPWDISLDDIYVCGINMNELRDLISKSKHKETIVMVLDCCYSGIAARDDRTNIMEGLSKEKFSETIGIPGKGRFVLTSGGKDQKSKEIENCVHGDSKKPHPHGWFTYHFIEGIDGKAADDRGIVTLQSVQNYVSTITTNEEQKPTISISEGINLNNVIISISKEIFRKKKDQLIKEVTNFHQIQWERLNLITLKDKSTMVKILLEIEPTNQEALKHKSNIEKILNDLRVNLYQWLTDNEFKYYATFDQKFGENFYIKLYAYMDNLLFEPFVNVEDKIFCFIKAIYNEYKNPGASGDFLFKCNGCFNLRNLNI